MLRLPRMLGHLGQGSGCFPGHRPWDTLPGLVQDIGVAGAAVGFVGASGFGAAAEGEVAEGGEVAAAESPTEGAECANGACFVAGTPVQMADGSTRAIERIRPGDRVRARDPRSGRVVLARVTRTFVRAVDHTVLLTLPGGEQIETTETHPFLVQGRGWVQAGELGVGTQILTRAGPGLGIAGVRRLWQATRVYNFEVEGVHCYFVGTSGGGLCVHNAPCPSWESPGGLRYESGSAQGNRIAHVFEHLAENPAKYPHSVFSVQSSQELIDLLDEVWSKKGLPDPSDPGAYVVDLGRQVGTAGQQAVRLVVKPGTNTVVTAYPVWGP